MVFGKHTRIKGRIKIAGVATLLALAVTGQSLQAFDQIEVKTLSEENKTQLNEYFKTLAENGRFIGTAAIYQDTQPLYKISIVPATRDDRKWQISKDNHLIYKIGSISKTYTSSIIFQLIEEGKLNLNSKLSEFYPKVKNAEKITIKHLLNHKSGIFNYTSNENFFDYLYQPKDKAFLLSQIESFDPVFEPDERAEYSNSGYLLLGFIAEDIEKKPFSEIVQQRIGEPFNLTNTYYGGTINEDDGEVYSYEYRGQWRAMKEWNMNVPGAAGALVSNADELNQFINLLFDGKVISKDSLKAMTTMDMNYGLGIFATSYGDEDNKLDGFQHSGGIEAFRSYFAHYPERDVTVVILSNGLRYDMNNIYNTMLDAYHSQAIKMPKIAQPVRLVREQLEPLVGEYSSDTFPLDIKISVKGNQLYAVAEGKGDIPLTAYSDSQFEFLESGIEMRFDRDNDQFLFLQGGKSYIFTKGNVKKQKRYTVPLSTLEQYIGLYGADNFPVELEIKVKEGKLYGQATGQSEFPLTAISENRFRFMLAGIVISFEAGKNQLIITQHGKDTVLTRK